MRRLPWVAAFALLVGYSASLRADLMHAREVPVRRSSHLSREELHEVEGFRLQVEHASEQFVASLRKPRGYGEGWAIEGAFWVLEDPERAAPVSSVVAVTSAR